MKKIMKFCFTFTLLFSSLFLIDMNLANAATHDTTLFNGQSVLRSSSVDVNSSTPGLAVKASNRSNNPYTVSLVKNGSIINTWNVSGNQFFDIWYLSTLTADPGNYYLLLSCPSSSCGGGTATISSF